METYRKSPLMRFRGRKRLGMTSVTPSEQITFGGRITLGTRSSH